MPTRVWAFVQSKGGSGKSVLATNIAVQAEAAGKPVLLVDLDAQSSAALWGSLRGSKKPTVFEGRPEKLAEIIEFGVQARHGHDHHRYAVARTTRLAWQRSGRPT